MFTTTITTNININIKYKHHNTNQQHQNQQQQQQQQQQLNFRVYIEFYILNYFFNNVDRLLQGYLSVTYIILT